MKLYSSVVGRAANWLLMIAWLWLAGTAAAGPMKLDSLAACDCTYKHVTILTFNATHVYFSHDGGVTCVKLKYLDPKLQALFGYNEAAAAEAEKRQDAAEALYQEAIVSNLVAQAEAAALAARRAAATSEDSVADPVSKMSLIGKLAPAIEGEKWLGEKPELKGRAVLVAFWAPWSIPCRKYIPQLDGLQKKFGDKLAVVGVTADSEAEVQGMAEPKLDFATVLDPKDKLGATIGVRSIPYVMLVDSKGVVRYQGHPAAITEKQVERLLAKAEK